MEMTGNADPLPISTYTLPDESHLYTRLLSLLMYNVWLAPVAGNPADVAASTMLAEPPPPLPPSVTLTMLPAAFFVNALPSNQLIASSFVSRSLVVGTAFVVYDRFGFILFAITSP
jgi:hypothetical protein